MQGHGTTGGSDHQLALVKVEWGARFGVSTNDYVSKIVLIDGSRLAELMIEFGVAVATDATYTVKRIDNDFFESI